MIKAACAIILDDKGKCFISKRSMTKKEYPGLWELPGGKFENDEDVQQCIIREIKEEIGVDITYIDCICIQNVDKYNVHYCLCKSDFKNISTNSEIEEYKFIEENNKFLKQDLLVYQEQSNLEKQISETLRYKNTAQKYMSNGVQRTISLMQNAEFINDNQITLMGIIAGQFQEIHPLVMAKVMVETNYFENLSSEELAGLFACFINISISRAIFNALFYFWRRSILASCIAQSL